MREFDIVVCAAAKDLDNVIKVYESLKRHTSFKRMIVITQGENLIEHDGIVCIDEGSVLDGLDYKAIEEYFAFRGVKPSRVGWYLQQFLKISYASICSDDYYLVWDADTCMFNNISFFDKAGRMLYDNSRIWGDKDFNKTVEMVLGFQRPTKETFIVEHMMMNKAYIEDMVSFISQRFSVGRQQYWRAILDVLSDEALTRGGFSEFELIGSYMYYYHNDSIAFRKLRSCRNIANILGNNITEYDMCYIKRHYDFASLEKSHQVVGSPNLIERRKRKNRVLYSVQVRLFSKNKRM